MPDWRSGSHAYVKYAQSQDKKEPKYPFLSIDAIVDLVYGAEHNFGVSINGEPPKSMFDTVGPMAGTPLSTSVVENAQNRNDDEFDQESDSDGDEFDYESEEESDDEDKASDELPTDLPDDEEPGKASDNNSTSSVKIGEAHSKTAATQDGSINVHAAADGQVENIEQQNGAGEGTTTSTETGTGVNEVD